MSGVQLVSPADFDVSALCAAAGLDHAESEVIALRAEGLGYELTARETSRSRTAVRYRTRRALDKLERHADAEGVDLYARFPTLRQPHARALGDHTDADPLERACVLAGLDDLERRVVHLFSVTASSLEVGQRADLSQRRALDIFAAARARLPAAIVEALPEVRDLPATLADLCRLAGLTDDEREVIFLRADGLSNAAIAARIGRPRALQTRLRRAREKLDVYVAENADLADLRALLARAGQRRGRDPIGPETASTENIDEIMRQDGRDSLDWDDLEAMGEDPANAPGPSYRNEAVVEAFPELSPLTKIRGYERGIYELAKKGYFDKVIVSAEKGDEARTAVITRAGVEVLSDM